MLTHPTHDRLIALGLTGMAKAIEEQRRQPDVAALAFEERLAMMIDREAIERENKRLVSRLKFACLRQSAVVAMLLGGRGGAPAATPARLDEADPPERSVSPRRARRFAGVLPPCVPPPPPPRRCGGPRPRPRCVPR